MPRFIGGGVRNTKMYDIKRDAGGNAVMRNLTTSFLNLQGGETGSTKTTGVTGNMYFVTWPVSVVGSANIALLINGSTQYSNTLATTSDTFSASYNSPIATPADFTMKYTFNVEQTTTWPNLSTEIFKTNLSQTGTTYFSQNRITTVGTIRVASVTEAGVVGGANSITISLTLAGSILTQTTITSLGQLPITGTWTGTWTGTPNPYLYIHKFGATDIGTLVIAFNGTLWGKNGINTGINVNQQRGLNLV